MEINNILENQHQQYIFLQWLDIHGPIVDKLIQVQLIDYHGRNQEHYSSILGWFHLDKKQKRIIHMCPLFFHYKRHFVSFDLVGIVLKNKCHPLYTIQPIMLHVDDELHTYDVGFHFVLEGKWQPMGIVFPTITSVMIITSFLLSFLV
jgi:hypothetical protein